MEEKSKCEKNKEMKENDMDGCMAEVGIIEQHWIRLELWTKIMKGLMCHALIFKLDL